MDYNLTLTAVSKMAGISDGLARHYRKRFGEYLHAKGQGRNRLYSTEAVEVLTLISEAYKRNATATEIEEALERRFKRIYEVEPGAFRNTEAIAKSEINPLLTELIQEVRTNREVMKMFASIKTENDQLRSENEALKARICEYEEQKRLEHGAKASWWKFWKK